MIEITQKEFESNIEHYMDLIEKEKKEKAKEGNRNKEGKRWFLAHTEINPKHKTQNPKSYFSPGVKNFPVPPDSSNLLCFWRVPRFALSDLGKKR